MTLGTYLNAREHRVLFFLFTSHGSTPIMACMRDEYDSPWKIILERYFQDFLAFFFPDMHSDIQWQRGYESLDTELQKVVRDAQSGDKRADKLIKVYRSNGDEQLILIHIEVQSSYDAQMEQRMFRYYYRLLDKYQKPVVSLAVYADNRPNWKPANYHSQLWGCTLHFEFPTIKLLDYQSNWQQLEANDNVFALIVVAHLKTSETHHAPDQRLYWKFNLVKRLYTKGYQREDVLELFRFIDWLFALPAALEAQFQQQLIHLENDMGQPYISTIERHWLESGIQQGLEQGLEQGLAAERLLLQRLTIRRFGKQASQLLVPLYNRIKEPEQLVEIGEWIFDSPSIEDLEQRLRLLIGSQQPNG